MDTEQFDAEYSLAAKCPSSDECRITVRHDIPLYEEPGGKRVGTAEVQMINGISTGFALVVREIRNTPIRLEWGEYYCHDYHGAICAPLYFARRRNHLSILATRYQGGVWVRLRHLSKYLEVTPWIDRMRSYHWSRLKGVDGLVLRQGPFRRAGSIKTLRARSEFVFFTGKTKGRWAEVIAGFPDATPVRSNQEALKLLTNTGHYLRGWLEIIDEWGYPRILEETPG